jgi:ankyrin repeat protein
MDMSTEAVRVKLGVFNDHVAPSWEPSQTTHTKSLTFETIAAFATGCETNNLAAAQDLVHAVRASDSSSLTQLVNARPRGGFTQLHKACARGAIAIVNFLLENQADVSLSTYGGTTAVMLAAANGAADAVDAIVHALVSLQTRAPHLDEIERIVKSPLRMLDAADLSGDCALTLAVKNSHEACVMALLRAGCNIDVHGKAGRTPLMIASTLLALGVLKLLLQYNAAVDETDDDGCTALMLASGAGVLNNALQLMDAGADISACDAGGYTALLHAAKNGHEDICRALLQRGANGNHCGYDGSVPVLLACAMSHNSLLQTLLLFGCDTNVQTSLGNRPIVQAALLGSEDIVRTLLASGADVEAADFHETTALIGALARQHTDIIDVLLAAGADVNHSDDRRQTPLMHAAKFADTSAETANVLLAHGADLTLRDSEGNTALAWAAMCGNTDVLSVLLAASEPPTAINVANNSGATPVALAAQGVRVHVLKALIAAGADINIPDRTGTLPLIKAATMGRKLGRRRDFEWLNPSQRVARTETLLALIEAGSDIPSDALDDPPIYRTLSFVIRREQAGWQSACIVACGLKYHLVAALLTPYF